MDPVCTHHPDKPGKYYCAKYNRYLCDECLSCQDPTLYCKHRTSCFIWEIVKHGSPDDQEAAVEKKAAVIEEKPVKITFFPGSREITAKAGETLLEAARDANVYINARCGGKGVCGSCKVKVEQGEVDSPESVLLKPAEKEKGYVLACTCKLKDNVSIHVPDENQARALQITESAENIRERILEDRPLSPFVSRLPIEVAIPSLDDPTSDWDRIKHALSVQNIDPNLVTIGLPGLRQLAQALRNHDWKVELTLVDHGATKEVIHVTGAGEIEKLYGVAIDLGTTSVVVYLTDLETGDVVGVTSAQNRQVVCGEDVISRIVWAKNDDLREKLQKYAIDTINCLIDEVCTVAGVSKNHIMAATLAGNTVMTQSALNLDPSSIRLEPYVPTITGMPLIHADDIRLDIHPQAAFYVVPGNAAYVGGDITAGIVSSKLNKEEGTILFIDVGTNGEMVLGNKDWLMTAACSAGPAFEGGGIRHGMRALTGAVEKVVIDPATLEPTIQTVQNKPAVGICGSGMIELIGELFFAKIVDTSGKFSEDAKTDRVRKGDLGMEYVLVWEKDNGLEEDIVLTEVDIQTLLRSKAAVYGGIRALLDSSGLTPDMIDSIRVAGGFGKHIDFDKAVALGMFPDVDREKYIYLGNSAIAGAYLALASESAREELASASEAMTYIDFSSSTLFFDEYQQAMFLPHTELRDFPSIAERLGKG